MALMHEPVNVVRRMWALCFVLLTAAAMTSVAALFDERTIGHVGVWTKPLKFQLALSFQTATIAWALSKLDRPTLDRAMPRSLWRLWLTVVLFEASYITLQGGRGVLSHFNRSTPLESVLGTVMAAGASILVLTTVWVGVCALLQARRTQWPSLLLGIGLGFVLGGLLAGYSGGAMGPSGYWPEPLVQPVKMMPITGWVISQTDLRIAHFVGLHQMQWLPAVAIAGVAMNLPQRTINLLLIVFAAIAPVVVVSLM
jgi:hypothetical protein